MDNKTLYLVQLLYTDYSEGMEYAQDNQTRQVIGIFDSQEKAEAAVENDITNQTDTYDFDYEVEDVHCDCTIPDKVLSFYDEGIGLIKTFEYEILIEELNFVQNFYE